MSADRVTGSAPAAVSVLIPAYGTAAYIAETLDSVLAQTRTDWEILVINDGDPNTPALEAALEPYRDRIRYIVKENGGLASARNAGLQVAQGRYVALLDSDDIWEPRFLELLIEALDAHPRAAAAFPDALIFGGGPWVGKRYFDIYTKPSGAGAITCERLLRRQCYIFGSLVMRREMLDGQGGFDAQIRASEDFDLWLRFTRAGHEMVYVDEPLVRYRARETSLSSDASGMYRSLRHVYEKFLRQDGLTDAERAAATDALAGVNAELSLALGRKAFFAGDYATAKRELSASNERLRSRKTTLILAGLSVWPAGTAAAVKWYMRRRGETV